MPKPPADSRPRRVPWQLLRRLDPTGQRAIANAREAVSEIATAVADRRVLTLRLTRTPDAGASELVQLPEAECLRLLGTRSVGRLGFLGREGHPLVLPVNYVLDGNAVLIRSGPGAKLAAAEREAPVCLEVDDIDELSRSGWSVLITGTAERLRWAHGGKRAAARRGARAPVPWAAGPREHVIRITATKISGRRLIADRSVGGWEAQ